MIHMEDEMAALTYTDNRAFPRCLVGNRPRKARTEARPIPALPALAAKRPPLRALPLDALSWHFWSKGKPFYSGNERRVVRGLSKPLVAQTLDDMCGGSAERAASKLSVRAERGRLLNYDYGDVLPESRQSFLSNGHGVLSLDFAAASSDEAIGTLAEFIPDDHPLRALAAVDEELDPTSWDTEFFVHPSDEPRMTPYIVIDPITAKQIRWERERAQDGEMRTLRLTTNEDNGKLTIKPDRNFPSQEAFIKAASNVKRWLLATVGEVATLDDFRNRIDLMADALAGTGPTIDFDYEALKGDLDAKRANEFADLVWHSAYEIATPKVVILPDDAWAPTCPRFTCRVVDPHVHERHTRLVHRSALRSKDEFWNQRLPEIRDYELGTDGLVEPLVTDPA